MPQVVVPPQPTEIEAPPPQDERPPRELPIFSRREVSANQVVDGDKGKVILDGSETTWPSSVSGVVMRSTAASHPDITAHIGIANGTFRILSHHNVPVVNVTTEGYVGIGTTTPVHLLHITRNHDDVTAIRISNDNAGTASAAALRSLRFTANNATSAQISSVGSGSTGFSGGPNALILWNHLSAPTVIGTSNAERLRVHANGNVTVGSATDYGRFGVFDSRDAGFAAFVVHETLVEAYATQFDYGSAAMSNQTVNTGVQNGGATIASYSAATRAGAGWSWRAIGVWASASVQDGHNGTISEAIGLHAGVAKGGGTIDNGYGVYIDDIQATNGFGVYQLGASDANFFAGKVGIGTAAPTHSLHVVGNGRVTGDLVVDGNIAAKFQDLAEWVPATEDLAPGTVVVLDPTVNNQVMASARAYDTTVAGVVSVQPGIILGEAGAMKEQVATTGRVIVRVDATRAPVRIGDLLVSSDIPGTAMKSIPVEIGGVAMHRPGTLIGKALEPLDGGVGEILVLLSLQ